LVCKTGLTKRRSTASIGRLEWGWRERDKLIHKSESEDVIRPEACPNHDIKSLSTLLHPHWDNEKGSAGERGETPGGGRLKSGDEKWGEKGRNPVLSISAVIPSKRGEGEKTV